MKTCNFAHAGTYGHECGKPAQFVAVKRSDRTTTGFFYAGRCEKCATIRGGENHNTLTIEPIDAARHVNVWRDNVCFA